MSLDSFQFYNPTRLFFGKDAIEKIISFIKGKSLKKILLLFGEGSVKKNGVYDRIKKIIDDNEIAFVEVWGVQANPLLSTLNEAIAVAKSELVEAVVAVGGGSVIDTAKGVCFGRYYEGDPWDFYKKGSSIFPKQSLPLFTILTLSATGSEYNTGSVIYNPEEKLKLVTYFTFPVASAVDPTIQYSLPWRQTFCGATDALIHLMESYFSLPNESFTTRELNLSLQRSIVKSMEILVKNPTDYTARASLCWAATLALSQYQRMGLSTDFNVHKLEKAISPYSTKFAHGEGLAILSLQYYPFLYNKLKTNPGIVSQFVEWAEYVFETSIVEEGFQRFREMYALWKAPLSLKELGIPKDDIEQLLENEKACRKINPLSPLFPMDDDSARDIYYKASGY